MARRSCVSLFAFFTATIALLVNIAAVGTTSWLVSSNDLKMEVGVFRHCDLNSKYCGGMSEISAIVDAQVVAWFRAVQALFLLCVVGNLLACILIGLALIRFFDGVGTFKVIAVVSLGAVAAGTTALGFFGYHYRDVFVISSEQDYLGFSFYLAISAVCFLFISFISSSIEATQTSKVLQNMQHRLTVWSTPYTLFLDQDP